VNEHDTELLTRADALQAEADAVIATLDLAGLFADIGPIAFMGSYVSGLLSWRDLDVGLLAGPACGPTDVLAMLGRVAERVAVTGFSYADERGDRCPTEQERDERYHVPIEIPWDGATWRIDLSVWLHDLHTNVRDWHEELRTRITPEERLTVLRIKDVWWRLPTYPDEIGGGEIYEAVLQDGVLTPDAFDAWLVARGLPGRG